MIGKLTSITIGAAILSAAMAGHANTAYYSINGGPAVAFGTLSDTFQGPAALTKSCLGAPINLNCTLTLGGSITEIGGDTLELTINSAASTGAGLCTNVGFTNLPWTGTYSHPGSGSLTPAVFTVSGIGVSTSCGSCSGSVTATFENTGLGEFSFVGTLPGGFLGDCIVNGNTIDSDGAGSGDEYRVFH
jgi:hypothetical protein